MIRIFINLTIIFSVLIGMVLPLTAAQEFRPDNKAYQWADRQLAKMSLDEKIGQMIHIGVNAEFMNQSDPDFQYIKRQVQKNHVGGIIVFVGGVYDTVHLINRMQESAKIPLLVSADFETGVAMRLPNTVNFPWNMALAATGNPAFARREGVIVAKETRALGIHWNFAPVADVNNNSKNPVINVRSYGEDPEKVGKFATEFMLGLQSGNVLATAKHFPGHGDTAIDSHRGLPVLDFSLKKLEKNELIPFLELIRNGVGSIMVSHISLPQLDSTRITPLKQNGSPAFSDSEIITEASTVPATLSNKIVTGILKNDLKFDGLVATDAMDMSGLTLYFNAEESAVRAVLAGNDVLLKPFDSDAPLRGIREAVKTGRITGERINESVRKILAWKYKLGLTKKQFTPLDSIDTVVSSGETISLSGEIAENAITLVKNEDHLLPFKAGQKVVLLCISNGEDRNTIGYSFASGLRGNGLLVERIAIDTRSNEAEIKEAIKKASEADVVVAGLFGRVRSGSKDSVGLPESGERVLKEVLKSDAKVISVAFGNPYLLLGFPEMKNYVVAFGDMVSLQEASAGALTGKIDFKGKLPITVGNFPRGTGLSLK